MRKNAFVSILVLALMFALIGGTSAFAGANCAKKCDNKAQCKTVTTDQAKKANCTKASASCTAKCSAECTDKCAADCTKKADCPNKATCTKACAKSTDNTNTTAKKSTTKK